MVWQVSPELKLKLRNDDIRQAQKRRRARLRRIDYQNVSSSAGKAIDALRAERNRDGEPCAYSDILNAIIDDWIAANALADSRWDRGEVARRNNHQCLCPRGLGIFFGGPS